MRTAPLLALGLAYLVTLATLLPRRHWDPDEFEHAQAAWLIAEGWTPFVDFFEHHTPLWHLLAAPVAAWQDPTDFARAMTFLVGARLVSLACGAIVAGLTWALARTLADARTAWLAIALLAGESYFILKAVELRPDILSTLGLVATALALARASPHLQASAPSRAALAWVLLAGIAQGIAIMASQKAICAAPGFAIAFLCLALPRAGMRATAILAGAGLAGAVLVAAPILAWFAARGALGAFLHHTITIHLDWTRAFQDAVLGHLMQTLRHDPVFALLTLVGTAGLAAPLRRAPRAPLALLTVPPLLSFAFGAAVLPIVQEQYFLMALPFAAICAAWAALRLVALIPAGRPRTATMLALAALLLATTARNLHAGFHRRDDATRAELAHLLATVPRDATVLGGWTPGIAFRHPAWFYFFLHDEVQAHIPPAAYRALAEALRDGTLRPAVIDLDPWVSRLPPEVLAAIRLHYAPDGTSTLQRRRAPP